MSIYRFSVAAGLSEVSQAIQVRPLARNCRLKVNRRASDFGLSEQTRFETLNLFHDQDRNHSYFRDASATS
jgi:hypothetical protein